VAQEPRFIDTTKCTGCGACTDVCPVELPNEFNLGLDAVKAINRLYSQAIPSTFVIKKYDRAPCTLTCPAGINVQGYVQLIKLGKYKEAVQLIMERLPLPGVLGRICPHPCEEQCRRRELDEAVAICALKRFAADQFGGPAGEDRHYRQRPGGPCLCLPSGPERLPAHHL